MNVSDFDYELPEELIAQEPPAVRGGSRMLAMERETGEWQDRWFRDLPEFLREGDLLVMNDSRVLPARLLGHRRLSGGTLAEGRVEVLLLEQTDEWTWTALARPGKKLHAGARVVFGIQSEGSATLESEVLAAGENGERTLRFEECADFWQRLEGLGHVPLPPYIHRADEGSDRERYQTVFARERGSVAAPTAGLHFTDAMLAAIRARGVEIAFVTLHVGLGTFQPVTEERVEEHRLHEERYALPAATAAAIATAQREGRRVAAVGTTVVRTLEHCARRTGGWEAHSGRTDIFLYPGAQFLVVGAMLTNFHLPRSTLLMLVSAFAGRERVMAAYEHAVAEGYRFFSYGDCLWIG
jgi:S-adenosylmethionine:tRNA ribosyltransferase-isomerase